LQNNHCEISDGRRFRFLEDERAIDVPDCKWLSDMRLPGLLRYVALSDGHCFVQKLGFDGGETQLTRHSLDALPKRDFLPVIEDLTAADIRDLPGGIAARLKKTSGWNTMR
jgi:hypothetical protein